MTDYNSTNMTLHNSGSSGDNLIPEGYIRTVENIWLDSFNFTTVLTTADTVCIGLIPANRHITSVEIYLPNGFTPTNTTINVGVSGSTSLLISSSTAYVVGNLAATGSTLLVANKVTMNNVLGFPYITTYGTVVVSGGVLKKQMTRVYISLGVTAMTSPTAGTISSIIRYA